jgi:hypothetical protein
MAAQALLTLQSASTTLQKELVDLKLVLNAGKTKYMLFSKSCNNVADDLCISTLDGALIDRVSAYKYLGIWIDKKLSIKKHVDELVKK